ncbi:MAG TPA: nucleotidyl transferase AbiEii/AbiGii toxin family protein [Candidatus Dormibacteraeota bacterium]
MLPASRGILTELQAQVLGAAFQPGGIASEFGLAGGTGLHEFYAGARLSDDLDLFTYSPELVKPFGQALRAALPGAIGGLTIEIHRDFEGFQAMTASTPDGAAVRIDLGVADPPALGPVHRVNGTGVLDLADLVAGKAHAIADRCEPRDAFDLWIIVTRLGYSMEAVEALLFEKDDGIREYPPAWIGGLRELSALPLILPDDLVAMILVPVTERELREFLADAATGALERAARRLPDG